MEIWWRPFMKTAHWHNVHRCYLRSFRSGRRQWLDRIRYTGLKVLRQVPHTTMVPNTPFIIDSVCISPRVAAHRARQRMAACDAKQVQHMPAIRVAPHHAAGPINTFQANRTYVVEGHSENRIGLGAKEDKSLQRAERLCRFGLK